MPTFLYTFSCFNKTKDFEKISKVNDSLNQTTLILEQIEGYELKYLMETKNIDFNRWLIIFCELLISLEVGQEEFFFSHYDLHPANLINGSYHDFCIKMFHIKTFYIVQRGTYFP